MTPVLVNRLIHRDHVLKSGNDSFGFKNNPVKTAKPSNEKIGT